MRIIGLCALAIVGLSANAAAQINYPARPIRVIVPNAPGATTDLLGRIVFTRMSDAFGRQIVVDNRAGAGGIVGMEIGSRATPDGYTLIAVAASQLTMSPHILARLPYDPLRDFVPVGLYVTAQTALCVNASLPVKTVRDLIELAKAKPGLLNQSSAGVGTTSHLGTVMFTTLAGIQSKHVPYKGGGPSNVAVAQGEVQWTLPPLSAAMPHVKAGRVRCIATGGDRRSSLHPDMPTIAESGVPGFRFYGWNGVVAPRGAPKDAIVRFNQAMNTALQSAEVRKLYHELGEEPVGGSPEAFGKLIREDYEVMGKLVKLAGIKPE